MKRGKHFFQKLKKISQNKLILGLFWLVQVSIMWDFFISQYGAVRNSRKKKALSPEFWGYSCGAFKIHIQKGRSSSSTKFTSSFRTTCPFHVPMEMGIINGNV